MKFCLHAILSFLLGSCAVNKSKHWDKATYSKEVNVIGLFERKFHQPEPKEDTNPGFGIDTFYHQSSIKTSDVRYFELGEIKNEHYLINNSKNNCRVYLPKSDTLEIRIGYDFIGVGSGRGFIIHYKNGKFYTVPYESHHIHSANEKQPIYKIRTQELILDKEKYNVGDSIFGQVYFQITEKKANLMYRDGRKLKNEHYAYGCFRGIVKSDLFW